MNLEKKGSVFNIGSSPSMTCKSPKSLMKSGFYDLDKDISTAPEITSQGPNYACPNDLQNLENRINMFFEEEKVHQVMFADYLKDLGQH